MLDQNATLSKKIHRFLWVYLCARGFQHPDLLAQFFVHLGQSFDHFSGFIALRFEYILQVLGGVYAVAQLVQKLEASAYQVSEGGAIAFAVKPLKPSNGLGSADCWTEHDG
jgi:hypothetical protein